MKFSANIRYATALRRFLRETISLETARAAVAARLAQREETFLRLLEHAVYSNVRSPYMRLLRHAGVELGDVEAMVREDGIEAALGRLYDAGVYVTYEELRGREPVRRGSLAFEVRSQDFDNPFLLSGYVSRTTGSTGTAQRAFMDLDNLAGDASYVALLLATHEVIDNPIAVWRPAPPDASGLNGVFYYTKLGRCPERWFSQRRFRLSAEGLRSEAFIRATIIESRLLGRPLPSPEYLPRDRADVVARWLAEKKRLGRPGYVDTSASAITRICIVANELGLDIGGSVFRSGGEPFTPAKAAVVASTGARLIHRYSMAETTIIGLGCGAPEAIDDLHVVMDKIGVIQRDKRLPGGASVPAFVYTTLQPTCPKLLLNAESGDYGSLVVRDCGCPLGELCFTSHISGIRGYDKLTSEGVTFMGGELFRLMEETLPARFGGYPTDYQLVEEEEGGLTRVSIVVAPGVGAVDEAAVVAAVLRELAGYFRGGALMADQWRQGGTLRVVRREPYASGGRKVLPLYVLQSSPQSGSWQEEEASRSG